MVIVVVVVVFNSSKQYSSIHTLFPGISINSSNKRRERGTLGVLVRINSTVVRTAVAVVTYKLARKDAIYTGSNCSRQLVCVRGQRIWRTLQATRTGL